MTGLDRHVFIAGAELVARQRSCGYEMGFGDSAKEQQVNSDAVADARLPNEIKSSVW